MKTYFILLLICLMLISCGKPYEELDGVREMPIPESEKQRLADAIGIPALRKVGTAYVYIEAPSKENVIKTGQDFYDRYKVTDFDIINISVLEQELDEDELNDSKIRKEKGNEKFMQVLIKEKKIFSNDFSINQNAEDE